MTSQASQPSPSSPSDCAGRSADSSETDPVIGLAGIFGAAIGTNGGLGGYVADGRYLEKLIIWPRWTNGLSAVDDSRLDECREHRHNRLWLHEKLEAEIGAPQIW